MNNENPAAEYLDPDTLPAQPGWPKPVGIVSIVLGSLMGTCGGCGLLMSTFSSSFMKGAEDKMGPMPPDLMPSGIQKLLGVVSMVSPVLLVVAGAMTLSRRAVGRHLHLAYAPISIVLTIAGTILGIQQQMRLAQWMRENPDSQWAANSNPAIGWIMMGVITVISVGWPIFCLVWFGAMKKRPEVGRYEVPV